jgi:hypothetical protein
LLLHCQKSFKVLATADEVKHTKKKKDKKKARIWFVSSSAESLHSHQGRTHFFSTSWQCLKLVETVMGCMQLFFSKWGESGEVDLKLEFEHLIILTASRCLLGQEVRNNLFEDVSSLFHELDNGMLPISVLFPYLPIPAHRRRDRLVTNLPCVLIVIFYQMRWGCSMCLSVWNLWCNGGEAQSPSWPTWTEQLHISAQFKILPSHVDNIG